MKQRRARLNRTVLKTVVLPTSGLFRQTGKPPLFNQTVKLPAWGLRTVFTGYAIPYEWAADAEPENRPVTPKQAGSVVNVKHLKQQTTLQLHSITRVYRMPALMNHRHLSSVIRQIINKCRPFKPDRMALQLRRGFTDHRIDISNDAKRPGGFALSAFDPRGRRKYNGPAGTGFAVQAGPVLPDYVSRSHTSVCSTAFVHPALPVSGARAWTAGRDLLSGAMQKARKAQKAKAGQLLRTTAPGAGSRAVTGKQKPFQPEALFDSHHRFQVSEAITQRILHKPSPLKQNKTDRQGRDQFFNGPFPAVAGKVQIPAADKPPRQYPRFRHLWRSSMQAGLVLPGYRDLLSGAMQKARKAKAGQLLRTAPGADSRAVAGRQKPFQPEALFDSHHRFQVSEAIAQRILHKPSPLKRNKTDRQGRDQFFNRPSPQAGPVLHGYMAHMARVVPAGPLHFLHPWMSGARGRVTPTEAAGEQKPVNDVVSAKSENHKKSENRKQSAQQLIATLVRQTGAQQQEQLQQEQRQQEQQQQQTLQTIQQQLNESGQHNHRELRRLQQDMQELKSLLRQKQSLPIPRIKPPTFYGRF